MRSLSICWVSLLATERGWIRTGLKLKYENAKAELFDEYFAGWLVGDLEVACSRMTLVSREDRLAKKVMRTRWQAPESMQPKWGEQVKNPGDLNVRRRISPRTGATRQRAWPGLIGFVWWAPISTLIRELRWWWAEKVKRVAQCRSSAWTLSSSSPCCYSALRWRTLQQMDNCFEGLEEFPVAGYIHTRSRVGSGRSRSKNWKYFSEPLVSIIDESICKDIYLGKIHKLWISEKFRTFPGTFMNPATPIPFYSPQALY